MKTPPEIAIEIFRVIPDPRVERTKVHSLEIIMFIALCTYLSGGEGFYDMQAYAQGRKDWLRATVGMQSVPSHDTFNRVFQAICPEYFGECLIALSRRLRAKISGEVVAFDGKTHRRTGGANGPALHLLNAWSVENRLVLGQLAVEEKSNEITAVPQLMDMLALKGCIVTTDALNCQKTVAQKAIEKKADYVLAVKGNHPVMYDEIRRYMDALAANSPAGFESIEKDHGRIETRRYWQSEYIDWFEDQQDWAGLQSFCLVESSREYADRIESSRRYYISSLSCNEAKIAHSIRGHWHIENSLHWCLDVVFNEDQSRARARHAAKNLGTLRAICLNLIKRIPGKLSMKSKRFQASLSDEYLFKALKI
jgi:predicted transposase YbfD/YdcC